MIHGPLKVKHSASVTKTIKSVLYREMSTLFSWEPHKKR